jgi:hypothetical protein
LIVVPALKITFLHGGAVQETQVPDQAG